VDLHGKLIAFEGVDGSGKSTQARLLVDRLRSAGHTVTSTREPGGTSIGEDVRRLLLSHGSAALLPFSELLLFLVCRAQLIAEVIRPALDDGQVVITSRYRMSSLAFQGYGRGLDRTLIKQLNEMATDAIEPDVVFLLDLPVDAALARLGHEGDRIEREARAFHERVRRGYLEIAKDNARTIVLNGLQPVDSVADEILEHLRR